MQYTWPRTYKFELVFFDQHDRLDQMLVLLTVDSNVDPLIRDDWHRSNLNQHHQQLVTTTLSARKKTQISNDTNK